MREDRPIIRWRSAPDDPRRAAWWPSSSPSLSRPAAETGTRGERRQRPTRLDERLDGPALAGVTSRRDYPWFHHMVTNPDSMIRNDSIGKALLAEYLTPMSNQGVTGEEARALFEYFRRVDQSASGAAAAGADGGTSASSDGDGS